jgi:hypothetical protein
MSGSEAAHSLSQEEIWRRKLSDAQRRYHEAVRELAGSQPGAAERKAVARQEYLRVLRIFTDLIVRGIRPKS